MLLQHPSSIVHRDLLVHQVHNRRRRRLRRRLQLKVFFGDVTDLVKMGDNYRLLIVPF